VEVIMLRYLVLAAAVAAQISAASPGLAEPAEPSPIVAASSAPSAAVSSSYRIGADDTLEIVVFQVPELTRTVQVDANGQFTLPFVGTVNAAGRTADEIAKVLTDRLNGGYLRDPQVTVLVKEAVSQRVTVDGGVVKPGVYSIAGPTSLMQAIALANGPDNRIANIKKVAVFRMVGGQRTSQTYDLSRIRDGKVPDPRVQPDDIIVVGISGTRSFFANFGSSLPILSIFRPY
jgi:polysaccharide export outer membrane protein